MIDPIDMTYWQMWKSLSRCKKDFLRDLRSRYTKRKGHFMSRKLYVGMNLDELADEEYQDWLDTPFNCDAAYELAHDK